MICAQYHIGDTFVQTYRTHSRVRTNDRHPFGTLTQTYLSQYFRTILHLVITRIGIECPTDITTVFHTHNAMEGPHKNGWMISVLFRNPYSRGPTDAAYKMVVDHVSTMISASIVMSNEEPIDSFSSPHFRHPNAYLIISATLR